LKKVWVAEVKIQVKFSKMKIKSDSYLDHENSKSFKNVFQSLEIVSYQFDKKKGPSNLL